MRLFIVVGSVLLLMVGSYTCFVIIPALVLCVVYNTWNVYFVWAEGIGPGNWLGIPITVALLFCLVVAVYEHRRS